jgi:hypothetical protein
MWDNRFMKIQAPFTIIQQGNTDVCQATHTKWFVGVLRLNRLRVYSNYPKTRMATQWQYVREQYLGSMMLSIPSHTWSWRNF